MEDAVLTVVSPELEQYLKDKLTRSGYNVLTCSNSHMEVYRAMVLIDPLMIVAEHQEWLTRLRTEIKQLGVSSEIALIDTGRAASYEQVCKNVIEHLDELTAVRRLVFTEIEERCTQLVADALNELCITPNYSGYAYIRDILTSFVIEKKEHDFLCKSVYPDIAKRYGTSPGAVERSIRTVVRTSWKRADRTAVTKYLGAQFASGEQSPTNREFLCIVANNISAELEEYKRTLRTELLNSKDL